MAVFMLVECPNCHRRLSMSSKLCQTKKRKGCTLNLDKAKKANKVFYWIAYRLPGEKNPVWERFKTKEDAEAYKTDREDKINKGILKTKADLMPKPPAPKPQDTMTIQQLSEWYLNQEYIKTKKSFFQKKNSLRNFNKVFGNRIVSCITVAELKNYQVNREEKDKVALSTIDQEIGEAKTVIYTAYENDMVDESVRKRFAATKELLERGSNKRTAIISQGQYQAIYQKLPERSRDPFLMLRWTGMREGEVLGLVWNRVLPLEDRVIRLDATETKDKQERIIPMSGEVFFCLQDRYREVVGNPVTPEQGQFDIGMKRIFTVTKDQFIYDVRGACKDAGIPYGRTLKNGFTPHSLRHTFNTEMALTGIPQFVIQELTGHSSDEMFKRYLHIMTATKKRAIEQLEEYVNNGQGVAGSPAPDSSQSVNQSVNKTAFQTPKNEKEISQIPANPL